MQEQNDELVRYTIEMFGKIDILVLCAGISYQAKFSDQEDLSHFKKVVETNLYSYVSLTYASLPHLRSSKGQIVAVSSMSGLIGLPYRTHYCASKFAVNGFFDALRHEEDSISFLLVQPPSLTGTNFRNSYVGGSREEEKGDNYTAYPAERMAQDIVDAADR